MLNNHINSSLYAIFFCFFLDVISYISQFNIKCKSHKLSPILLNLNSRFLKTYCTFCKKAAHNLLHELNYSWITSLDIL